MLSKLLVLVAMIALHIYDDFHRQGILANMKQKTWWLEECKKAGVDYKKYKNDYKVALIAHSVEWTIAVNSPVWVWFGISGTAKMYREAEIAVLFAIMFIVSVVSHAMTDDLKANKKAINLITDQLIHLGVILWIWSSVLYY